MDLLAWIVIGLVAGWLAGLVMKGSGYGALGDIFLGIIGAVIGGFIAGALFGVADPVSALNVTTIVVAFLGSVILVAIVRALPGRSPI